MIEAFAFYLFAGVLLLSAAMVIAVRNPVYSVLFLILAFFNAAGLFVLLGAEFVAFILVIVYVGAVAVLFLFVVMMLDISFADLRKGAMKFVPVGLGIGALMLLQLGTLYAAWPSAPKPGDHAQVKADVAAQVEAAFEMTEPEVMPAEAAEEVTNTEALGRVLYTDYVYPFQVSGLILLVAMIGAIVLTHRARPGTLRQRVSEQQARRPEDVIEIQKISPGSGV